MPSPYDNYAARAREFLASARASYEAKRLAVAYEEARTAAELSSKALLARAGFPFKKEHNVAGDLQRARLVPPGVSARALSQLLDDFSRGAYGFDAPPSRIEARDALALAGRMVRGLD